MKQMKPTMLTFSEHKVQRVLDSLRDLNPTEFGDFQQVLQNYEPEKRNDECGFLKLPAEIRNRIYHYVAEDAHAAFVVPKNISATEDTKLALTLRDKDGKKVRPGLLGTCRQIFKEFHGIFYSADHIKAWVW
ncbi:hypothetical protein M409DRAFT_53582 [Zasmidium cellare ATCC 36951]|uniref:F-box domain-containing protein n=1 Tax=Zasmidium cellare ATCC 36951 TaxID=1080233 RepID=A0A6A6CNT1_ZASCE|nr:uncharacterized protein M409DRAFT_53582 [Zasmidium cellare ATCC 36951]KAF2168303.1 hypothetical protein M409DRAFT_53582 [Zasmidium cellare ATCC 36951]